MKLKVSKLFCLTICISMCFQLTGFANQTSTNQPINTMLAYNNANVKKSEIKLIIGNSYMNINGESKEIDPGKNTSPIIKNGRTLLPIRAIIEALEGVVDWDGSMNKVTLTVGDKKIEMFIGSPVMKVNGIEKEIDPGRGTAPEIINGRTMLPVRSVIEEFGGTIEWDAQAQTVTIAYDIIFKNEEVIFQENHNSISDSIMLSKETSVTDNVMTMSKTEYDKSAIKEGDVITAGVTEKTPFGLLKKVKNTEAENGKMLIEMENAEVTELIKKADLRVSQILTSKNIVKNDLVREGISFTTASSTTRLAVSDDSSVKNGIVFNDLMGYDREHNKKVMNSPLTQIGTAAGGGFSEEMVIGFNDFCLYDKDGDKNTKNDSLLLNGSIQVKPSIDLSIYMEDSTVGSINFEVKNVLESNLNLTGDLSATWDKSTVIGELQFAPITVYSLVFTPVMKFVVGTDGSVNGHVLCGTKQKSTIKGWAKYYKDLTGVVDGAGSWTGGMDDGDDDTFEFYEPTFTGNMNAKVYAGAEGQVLLYGAFGGGVGLYPYIKAVADTEKTPWWTVKAGVQGQAKFEALVKAYSEEFIFVEKTVVDASYYDKETGGKYKPSVDNEGWGKYYTTNMTPTRLLSDEMVEMKRLANGDFLMLGESYTRANLIRTDKHGNIKWSKYVGEFKSGYTDNLGPLSLEDFEENSDGTILLLGRDSGETYTENDTTFLAKIDANGNVFWHRRIGVGDIPNIEYPEYRVGLRAIEKTKTGYAILLRSVIAKVDFNGNVITAKKITLKDTAILPRLYSLKSDTNGNLYMGGYIKEKDAFGNKDTAVLVKMDDQLNIKWVKAITFGAIIEGSYSSSIDIDNNGNVYMACWGMRLELNETFMCFIKMDSNGKNEWSNELKFEKMYQPLFTGNGRGLGIKVLEDDGLIAYGAGYDRKTRLVKLDGATGKVDWFKSMGDGTDKGLTNINTAVFDGKLIYFGGGTKQFSVKEDKFGGIIPYCPILFSTTISGSIVMKDGINLALDNISGTHSAANPNITEINSKAEDTSCMSEVSIKSPIIMMEASYLQNSITK